MPWNSTNTSSTHPFDCLSSGKISFMFRYVVLTLALTEGMQHSKGSGEVDICWNFIWDHFSTFDFIFFKSHLWRYFLKNGNGSNFMFCLLLRFIFRNINLYTVSHIYFHSITSAFFGTKNFPFVALWNSTFIDVNHGLLAKSFLLNMCTRQHGLNVSERTHDFYSEPFNWWSWMLRFPTSDPYIKHCTLH